MSEQVIAVKAPRRADIRHASFNPDRAQEYFQSRVQSRAIKRVNPQAERTFWQEKGGRVRHLYDRVGGAIAQRFGLEPLEYQSGAVRVAEFTSDVTEVCNVNSGLVLVGFASLNGPDGSEGEKYLAHGLAHLYQSKTASGRVGLRERNGAGRLFNEVVTELVAQEALAEVDPDHHTDIPTTRLKEIALFDALCDQLVQRGVTDSISQAHQIARKAAWGDESDFQRWQELLRKGYPESIEAISNLSKAKSGQESEKLSELDWIINYGK
ncbi:MAG: hypothetical protein JW991_00305 [Candidatus Pacebacteria bacterium]|nr:hypothetical protein [Candidatus Paceibacterota bacterium]